MARPKRRDYAGARHHVMNRGLRRMNIFIDRRCRPHFLKLLRQLHARYGVEVVAFALMPNHFHLLVVSHRGRLSEAMQWLQARFVQWLNARHRYDGPLFKGRFRSRLVLDEAYWAHLFAYVHRNPARAGIAPGRSASWTSRPALLGGAAWPDSRALIDAFGSIDGYRDYEARVAAGTADLPDTFDPDDLWSGNDCEVILPPGGVDLPDAAEALAAVAAVTRTPAADLLTSRQGLPAPASWLASWWLCDGAGMSQLDAAQFLQTSQQTVSRRVVRARRALDEDPAFRAWARALTPRVELTRL